MNIESKLSDIDNAKIEMLKRKYFDTFERLTVDEEHTIEFYYKLGETRGVDGLEYVWEAIKRAGMKEELDKPISYVASLCKSFYKKGLYSQPFQEETDIVEYIESKIGNLSLDNKKLLQSAISSNGAIRVMAAASETLNNSNIQDKIIEDIILRVVDIFGKK